MSWAHYLLQVNIYLIVFYCFYKLLLDKETYFILNRVYLISSGLLSLAIPFLRFEWLTNQPVALHMFNGVDQLSGFVSQVRTHTGTEFNWGNLIVGLYIAGILFSICKFIYQLMAVRKMFFNVGDGVAFSFLNKKAVAQDIPELATVNLHEEIHIRQKHTIDVLFFEFIAIFTWFNPVIYAYKHTVKNIHEFLADEAAANFQGDKEMYSLLLLSQAFGTRPSDLTNGFFSKSLIKKRIFMLHKQRSKKTAILKYGLFVPLFATTLLLSSSTIRKNDDLIAVSEKISHNNIETVVSQVIEAPLRIVEVEIAPKKAKRVKKKIIDTDTHANVINPPTYPGGITEYYDFLGKNIRYPESAVENEIEGTVFLKFFVEKDGSLNDIKIRGRKLGFGLDEESIRVLKLSKRWNPGMQNGKPVRVEYNIPIKFALPTEKWALRGSQYGAQNDVIYIINDEKVDLQAVNRLNPEHIESISVLKDASAIALYGKQAQNGVISITTKKLNN